MAAASKRTAGNGPRGLGKTGHGRRCSDWLLDPGESGNSKPAARMRGRAPMVARRPNRRACVRNGARSRAGFGGGPLGTTVDCCGRRPDSLSLRRTNIEALLACAPGTVRDRLWMWSHPAGSYNKAPNEKEWPFTDYGFTKASRMTPAEGALYLGLPNVIFVRYSGRPVPAAFDSVARTLQPFKRIIWSINISPQRRGPAQFRWTSTDEQDHNAI